MRGAWDRGCRPTARGACARPAVPELDHGLERLRVGEGHHPKELRPPAALVQVHLDGVLLLLEHLHGKNNKG